MDATPLKQEMAEAERRAAGGNLPRQLRDLSERHLVQLENLVETMRAAGVDEALVRHSVREVVESYEHELVMALMRVSEGSQ
jgi:hypothetical protein